MKSGIFLRCLLRIDLDSCQRIRAHGPAVRWLCGRSQRPVQIHRRDSRPLIILKTPDQCLIAIQRRPGQHHARAGHIADLGIRHAHGWLRRDAIGGPSPVCRHRRPRQRC
jgi:hypothetical protein